MVIGAADLNQIYLTTKRLSLYSIRAPDAAVTLPALSRSRREAARVCTHSAGSFSKDTEIHRDGEEQLAICVEVAPLASLYECNRLSRRVKHVAEPNLVLHAA